jgi:hypothetical protein
MGNCTLYTITECDWTSVHTAIWCMCEDPCSRHAMLRDTTSSTQYCVMYAIVGRGPLYVPSSQPCRPTETQNNHFQRRSPGPILHACVNTVEHQLQQHKGCCQLSHTSQKHSQCTAGSAHKPHSTVHVLPECARATNGTIAVPHIYIKIAQRGLPILARGHSCLHASHLPQ